MKVRCKVSVAAVEQYSYPPGSGRVKLAAVYESKPGVDGNAVTENHIFGKATPQATFDMLLNNPEAFRVFRDALDQQVQFYVDFTPAPQ